MPLKDRPYFSVSLLTLLTGTWSEKDLKEFQKNVEYLEKVDKEL
jgi:hypothetical protein